MIHSDLDYLNSFEKINLNGFRGNIRSRNAFALNGGESHSNERDVVGGSRGSGGAERTGVADIVHISGVTGGDPMSDIHYEGHAPSQSNGGLHYNNPSFINLLNHQQHQQQQHHHLPQSNYHFQNEQIQEIQQNYQQNGHIDSSYHDLNHRHLSLRGNNNFHEINTFDSNSNSDYGNMNNITKNNSNNNVSHNQNMVVPNIPLQSFNNELYKDGHIQNHNNNYFNTNHRLQLYRDENTFNTTNNSNIERFNPNHNINSSYNEFNENRISNQLFEKNFQDPYKPSQYNREKEGDFGHLHRAREGSLSLFIRGREENLSHQLNRERKVNLLRNIREGSLLRQDREGSFSHFNREREGSLSLFNRDREESFLRNIREGSFSRFNREREGSFSHFNREREGSFAHFNREREGSLSLFNRDREEGVLRNIHEGSFSRLDRDGSFVPKMNNSGSFYRDNREREGSVASIRTFDNILNNPENILQTKNIPIQLNGSSLSSGGENIFSVPSLKPKTQNRDSFRRDSSVSSHIHIDKESHYSTNSLNLIHHTNQDFNNTLTENQTDILKSNLTNTTKELEKGLLNLGLHHNTSSNNNTFNNDLSPGNGSLAKFESNFKTTPRPNYYLPADDIFVEPELTEEILFCDDCIDSGFQELCDICQEKVNKKLDSQKKFFKSVSGKNTWLDFIFNIFYSIGVLSQFLFLSIVIVSKLITIEWIESFQYDSYIYRLWSLLFSSEIYLLANKLIFWNCIFILLTTWKNGLLYPILIFLSIYFHWISIGWFITLIKVVRILSSIRLSRKNIELLNLPELEEIDNNINNINNNINSINNNNESFSQILPSSRIKAPEFTNNIIEPHSTSLSQYIEHSISSTQESLIPNANINSNNTLHPHNKFPSNHDEFSIMRKILMFIFFIISVITFLWFTYYTLQQIIDTIVLVREIINSYLNPKPIEPLYSSDFQELQDLYRDYL